MSSNRSGPCFQDNVKLHYGIEVSKSGIHDIRIYASKEGAEFWNKNSGCDIQILPVQDDHIDFINTYRFRD